MGRFNPVNLNVYQHVWYIPIKRINADVKALTDKMWSLCVVDSPVLAGDAVSARIADFNCLFYYLSCVL